MVTDVAERGRAEVAGVLLDVAGVDGVAAAQGVAEQLPATRRPGRRPSRRRRLPGRSPT